LSFVGENLSLLGGMYAILYASAYPKDVVGIERTGVALLE
jgi:hypothetical protein